MTVVSTLVIEMAANVARIQQDMDRARKVVDDAMGRIGGAVEGAQRAFGLLAAAAGGATFGVAIKNAINLADQMDDLAEKTGIAAKALSSLRYAGEATGTPMESMTKGLQKLSQNMYAAAVGGKEQAETFARLGVSVQKSSGAMRGSDEVLRDLADRFSDMQNGPAKAALAMDVFGKAGMDMVPLLNQGADGLENLHDEAVRLGAVVSDDFAAQAAAFNDSLTKMRMASEGFMSSLAQELVPTLNRLAEAFLGAQSSGSPVAEFLGKALKTAIETVSILGANLVFVFQGIWRELTAVYEQAKALISLDFSKMKDIKVKLDLDNEKALADLKTFESTVAGFGGRGAGFSDPRVAKASAELKELSLLQEAQARAQFEATQRQKQLAEEAHKARLRQAEEERKAQAKLVEEGVKLSDSFIAAQAGMSVDFASKWDALAAAFGAGRLSADQLAVAQAKLIEQQPFMKKAAEDREKAQKAQIDMDQKAIDSVQSEIDAIRKSNEAMALHNEEIGLTTEQLDALRLKRLDHEIAIQSSIVAEYEEARAMGTVTAQMQQQINKLDELIKKRGLTAGGQEAQASVEAAKIAADAAKKAVEDWQRAADKIQDTITDALMRGFESGKDFAQNLRDTLVNMFKTMVLRPQIQGIVSGGLGALGLGGPGQAAAGGMGGMGDMASMGLNALGLGGAGAMFSSGVMSGLSAWGAGGSVTGLLGSGSALFSGGLASGLGTIAGALGPIALGIAALYAISKKLDTSGTIHTGGSASYSAAEGTQKNISQARTGFAFTYQRAETADMAASMTQSIVGLLDMTAKSFGKTAGYGAATAFADDTSKDGAWGSLIISKGGKDLLNWADSRQSKWAPKTFADGEEGVKQYMAAVSKDVRDMLMQDTPGWADAMLMALGDSVTLDQLAGVVAQINQIQATFVQFGAAMPQLASLSDEAVGSLLGLAGGIQNLQSGLSAYYDKFYSDAEKQAAATKRMTAEMSALGLSLPATNAEYRKLVEAQDLNTEAGRRQYAALIALAPAFDQVSAAATQAMQRISQERERLELELLRAQGNTTELRARERNALDASNRGLYDQIKALEDAKAAQERYNEALSSAQSALAAAMDRVQSAQSAVDAVRERGTSAYLAALSEVAGIQEQIADQARQTAATYRDLAKQLREYVTGIVTPPSSSFAQALTKALGGDREAMAALPGLATSASDQARDAAGSRGQFAREQARILSGVLEAAAEAQRLGIETPAQAAQTLQQKLLAAQQKLAEATATANAIGAPLAAQQERLIDEYTKALAALAAANSEAALARAQLAAIATNTGNTATHTANTAANTSATGALTDELKKLGTVISVGGLVKFDPNDPIRSVFDNISKTNNVLTAQFVKWLEINSGSIVTQNNEAGTIAVSAITGFMTATNRGAGAAGFPGQYVLQYDSTNYLMQIATSSATTAQILNNLAFGQYSMLVRGFGPGQSVPVSFRRDVGSTEFFATGAAFTNGIATRPTGFSMGMMGEAGPEAIMPLSNINGSLGVRAQMPGMSGMLDELRALREEVANLRVETRAGVSANQEQTSGLRRLTRGWQSMPVTGVQNDPITVKVAA